MTPATTTTPTPPSVSAALPSSMSPAATRPRPMRTPPPSSFSTPKPSTTPPPPGSAPHTPRSDPETILHAFEQYGPDCVLRLRGMFAFAIWDKNSRKLFCARDRLGKKPFYYYWDGRTFAFASEIKALLEHPAISPQFDESLLPEYLAFGYV